MPISPNHVPHSAQNNSPSMINDSKNLSFDGLKYMAGHSDWQLLLY